MKHQKTFRWRRFFLGMFCFLVLYASASASLNAQDNDPLQSAIFDAVEVVKNSVVQIETVGGLDRVGSEQTNDGPTTGIAVSEDGYVISSAFNFIQQPAGIFVTTRDGKRFSANVVARDESRKVVLLKLHGEVTLEVPATVSRREIEVGQTAIALGKVYSAAECNVSVGIVSATHRIWDRAVQTDAKISPANFGGPLINLKGEVIGVLVPMSPNDEGVLSGAEWYDSGIGFAVPLGELLNRIEDLKSGKDLKPGRLGIELKGTNIYADPAIIATCAGGSPAAKAGLKPGDEITAVNGRTIARQAHLKHAIGALYAGDEVEVAAKRGENRFVVQLKLVEEVSAYRPVQIGVVPEFWSDTDLKIRYVVPDGPADAANVQSGDSVTSLDGEPLTSWQHLHQLLLNKAPKTPVQLSLNRNGKPERVLVVVRGMNAEILSSMPARQAPLEPARLVTLRLAEFPNLCDVIVPKDQKASSVLVWLPPPGEVDRQTLIATWGAICCRENLLVVIPRSSDATKWVPDEIEMVDKLTARVMRDFSVDSSRIAVGGRGPGGAMAALTVIQNRSRFRGLIVFDSLPPEKLGTLETSASQPLKILVGMSRPFSKREELVKRVEALRERHLPIHLVADDGENVERSSLESWREKWAVWVDALNRL